MLQSDYIILGNGIKGATDPERSGGQTMRNENINNTWLYSQFLEAAELERTTNPSAFLLSEYQSQLLNKANTSLNKASAPYIDFTGKKPKAEVYKLIAEETIKEFNKKRLPVKKLRKLSELVKTASYWSISPEYIQKEDINGLLVTAASTNYIIRVSDKKETSKIILDENHPFFKAETMQARAEALGLDNLFYVSKFDLIVLENLCGLFALLDAEQEQTETSDIMLLKSGPEYDFFVDLETAALAKAETHNKITPTGENITVFEILGNQGIKLETENTIDDIFAYKNPNTDKLFKQVMCKAIQTEEPTVEITLKEFMQARKLKDRKEAKKQLIKATVLLKDAEITNIAKKGKKTVGRTGQKIFDDYFIPEEGANFILLVFKQQYFNNMMQNKQVIKIPTKILMIPNNKANSYYFACKFLQRKRMINNHNQELDNRLSVKSLLKVSTLPRYEDINDKGQYRQLIIDKFEKAFDYLELSEEAGGIGLFSYYFTKAKGEKLTDAELSRMYNNYDFFESLYVNVVWYDDIDYTNVKDKHKKHDAKRAAAKTRKKSGADKPKSQKQPEEKPQPHNYPKQNNIPFANL